MFCGSLSRVAIVIAMAALLLPVSADSPYKVRFTVSNLENGESGVCVIEVHPEWAPKAAKRFELLLAKELLDNVRFTKVSPGFVAQFGIGSDPSEVPSSWDDSKHPPDVRKVPNMRGTVSFFPDLKDTPQGTELVLNIKDNLVMDDRGLIPFARVIEGMHVVDRLYSKYGTGPASPSFDQLEVEGNAYLERNFPRLSYISKVERLQEVVVRTVLKPSPSVFPPLLSQVFIPVSMFVLVILAGAWILWFSMAGPDKHMAAPL